MPITPRPEHLAHGNAPNPGRAPGAKTQTLVCGAFMNGNAFQIGTQQPLPQQIDIRIIGSSFVIQPAIQPAAHRRIKGIGNFAVVIVCIHQPGEENLPAIVHATQGLGFRFCPGQRWQQQPCQDGNDRDHDEEFDEREGRIALSRLG